MTVDLKAERAKRLMGGAGSMHKGRYAGWRVIHNLSRTELDSTKFHHATQNSMQIKTYKLFISGIFHLIFLDE
jgi:hypothetical protein